MNQLPVVIIFFINQLYHFIAAIVALNETYATTLLFVGGQYSKLLAFK